MVDKLKVGTELDNTGFKKGVKGMGGEVDKFDSKLKKTKQLLGGAFAIGAIANFGKQLTAFGSQISDLADRAGITAEQFQTLEVAAIKAGSSGEAVQKAFTKLNLVMGQAKSGQETYIKLFERAGISFDRLSRSNPIDVFQDLATTMSTAERGSSEFAAVLEILGTRTAPQLIEVMRRITDEGLDQMTQGMLKTSDIMGDEFIGRLDELEDKLQITNRRVKVFFGEALAKGAEQVEKLAREWEILTFRIQEASKEGRLFEVLTGFKQGFNPARSAIPQKTAVSGLGAGREATQGLADARAAFAEQERARKDKGVLTQADFDKSVNEWIKKTEDSLKENADRNAKDLQKLDEAFAKSGEMIDKDIKKALDDGVRQQERIDAVKGEEVQREQRDRLARIGGQFGGDISEGAALAKKAIRVQEQQLEIQKGLAKEIGREVGEAGGLV